MSDRRQPPYVNPTSEIMKEFEALMTSVKKTPFVNVGNKIEVSCREFCAVAVLPYTRRDGGKSQLITWQGHCASSGEPYQVKGSRNAKHIPLYCEQHRGRRIPRQHARSALRETIARALVAIEVGDITRARKLLSRTVFGDPEKPAGATATARARVTRNCGYVSWVRGIERSTHERGD